MKVKRGIYLFLSATGTTIVSGLNRQTRGSICEQNKECISQHCVPLCNNISNTAISYCIEPEWFYARHGLHVPTCIVQEHLGKKMKYADEGLLSYANKRVLGQTCHVDNNCMTKHCLPECSQSALWKCVEPRVFYERNRVEPPKCIAVEIVGMLNELKVPAAATRNLGETCLSYVNCISGNCVPVCEDLNESRCIEARFSFTLLSVPFQSCIDTDTTKSLLKLLVKEGGALRDVLVKRQVLDRDRVETTHASADRKAQQQSTEIKDTNKIQKSPQQQSTEIKDTTKIQELPLQQSTDIKDAGKIQESSQQQSTEIKDAGKIQEPQQQSTEIKDTSKFQESPQQQSTEIKDTTKIQELPQQQSTEIKDTEITTDKNFEKVVNPKQTKNVDKNKTNLRKDTKQQATPSSPVQEKNKNALKNVLKEVITEDEAIVKTIDLENRLFNKNKPPNKEISNDDFEAVALAKLRQIDLKVMELQADAMKKYHKKEVKSSKFQMFLGLFNYLFK